MGHVTRKENYRNSKINIVDNPRNRRTRSKIDGKEPIAGRDRARGSNQKDSGGCKCRGFPKALAYTPPRGSPGPFFRPL